MTRKNTKSTIAIVFAVLALFAISALIGVIAFDVSAETSSWTVKSGDWEASVENGETIYTKKSGGLAQLGFGTLDINYGEEFGDEITFEFRMNQTPEADGNIGLFLNIANGDTWFARFINGAAPTLVYNGGGGFNDFDNKVASFGVDEWVEFKFKATKGSNGVNLWLYLNDSVYAVFDTTSSLSGITLSISSWNMLPSVRNIKVKGQDTPVAGLNTFGWNAAASGWTVTGDGDETVYSAPDAEMSTLSHRGAFEGNTVSFSARPNVFKWNDANMGVMFVCGDGSQWFFDVYKSGDGSFYARLRKLVGSSETRIAFTPIDLPIDGYTQFKAVFDTDYAIMYIDGKRVISCFDTTGSVFDGAVRFSVWGTKPDIKNIVVSNTVKNYAEAGYIDFEFSDCRAVDTIAVSCGSKIVDDGALVWNIDGSDPVLTTTKIDVPRGTKYSALLSVRNTIAVRMKNETDAESVAVSFVTSGNESYDGRVKEFSVAPNSDYQTYYFNLSDVNGCDGFLRGFKMAFIGVSTGSVAIDAITFERETPIKDYAGAITSCTASATEKTVKVVGKVDGEHAGKKVEIFVTPVNNYSDDPLYADTPFGNPTHSSLVSVFSGTANEDGTFEAVFPLRNGEVTHLSSKFLAVAQNSDLIAPSFTVQNYRDFSDNPYEFELPELTVSVTEARFGAKGDGFTNDNDAIQAAIDYVSAQGGGAVVLTGDRRYVATNVKLKSNVELRIEKGAMLLQSQRASDYDYDVVYGHDKDVEGLVWCHAGVTFNRPLIEVSNVQNVRITGGGTIRMSDIGGEQPDGYHYEWSTDGTPNIIIGCANTIHCVPVGMYKSKNVELSDLTILRSNVWHTLYVSCENVYVANMDLREVECINGDGYSIQNTKNMIVDRCFLYSNDDAVVLSSHYEDGRGDNSGWWQSTPGEDNCVDNIVIRHSNLFGGLGIVFIPWGSADPDLSREEIKNIEVYDCVLGGTTRSVGSWQDNPFYGWSKYYDYDLDNGEKDDYSPVRNVVMKNNIYRNIVDVGEVLITNCITDCGLRSPSRFVNSSFERELRYENETEFVSGLSYWSSKLGENGGAGVEKRGTKVSSIKYPQSGGVQTATVADYAAYVKGNGELYQGLYLPFGAYEFNLKTKLVAGSAKLFARNAVTGDVIAQKYVTAGETFDPIKLAFSVTSGTTVQLGVIHSGEIDEIVYFDDAQIVASFDADMFKVDGEQKTWMFDTDMGFVQYDPDNMPLRVSGGALVTDNRSEYKIMLDQAGALTEFDVRTDILVPSGIAVNAGLYLLATDVRYAKDKISAYNVQAEYAAGDDEYIIRLYRFSATSGYVGKLTESGGIPLVGDKISLRAVVKHNTLFVFADGDDEYAFAYELPQDYEGGNVGLRSQFKSTRFDSFSLTSSQVREAAGIKTELDATLSTAKKFVEYAYTEASFAALKSAIEQAEALAADATQTQIDAARVKLEETIAGLKAASQTPPDDPNNPDNPDTPVTPETPDPIIKTVTVKDMGMTIGFYILLGLLIAGIAAATVVIVKSKRGGKKK